MAAEKAIFHISELCRALDVTPSGYYAWYRRPESSRARRDRQIRVLVRASFAASKQRYGSPRIHEDRFDSFGEAKMELFDYIEVFYNQRRRHSTLGQISPAAFERRAITQAA